MSLGSFHRCSTRQTFVVATSGGQKAQQTREFPRVDFDNPRELINMDAFGIIYEDIGDVLSESNTDASVVVYLHELRQELTVV